MFDCPKHILSLLNVLTENGYKAYIVGGCVRDYILGINPHDFDVTTNALPDIIIQVFSEKGYTVVPTGIKHGTVTVIANNEPVEVTTFRTDGEYKDNRRPETVSFASSFKDDASRRDFTVNALAWSPSEGIVDCFGGLDDIRNKTIRCVGNPNKRFNEDSLRILRAIRFASTLGFSIDNDTKNAIHNNKDLLKNISAERISAEFTKLLCGKDVKSILTEFCDVIAVFIPEIMPMFGFFQHNYHHIYDVWAHTVVAVDSIFPDPALRLAAFFHDIGKPETFSLSDDGVGHFYGHSEKSVEITAKVMHRLKYDNSTIERVLSIIKYHDLQTEEDKTAVRKRLQKLGETCFFDLIAMKRADTKALSPEFASRKEHYDELERLAEEIINENACFSLKNLALSGNDLIELGIPKGKEIGLILNKLLEKVVNEDLPNDKESLISYVISDFSTKK